MRSHVEDSRGALRLYLDLGDVFSKGIAARGGRVRRIRYPSVTATRLLDDAGTATDLLLDAAHAWPRPAGFAAADYPRTRSYQEARTFLAQAWNVHGEPVKSARFAGYVAAAYGAQRELLGQHPSADNVDALVRKALLMTADDTTGVEIGFVLGLGVKAATVQRYARPDARTLELLAWRFRQPRPRRLALEVRTRVIDAVECALAALPEEVGRQRDHGLLLVDVGYLRTKLALVTAEGCALQQEVDELGVSDCVRRVLRDGQDRGLFEDELAVMYALERSQTTIEIAGRRFDVAAPLAAAKTDLADAIARAAQRALVTHAERATARCRAVAVLGGGAPVVGTAVGKLLSDAGLGVERVWVSSEPSFLLVQGARRAAAQATPQPSAEPT